MASAAAHVGLIALAIAAQASTPAEGKVFNAPHERVAYLDAARFTRTTATRVDARPRPTPSRRARTAAGHPAIQFLPPELARLASVASVPVVTPDIDLRDIVGAVGDALGASEGIDAFVQDASSRAYRRASSTTLYSAETVERIAAPAPRNPKPRYPPALIMGQVEGSFVVRFVVDTTGHVEPSSLEFPESAHRYFVASVRDALIHSRYFPAEVGGHSVRQQVEQTFSFVLLQPR